MRRLVAVAALLGLTAACGLALAVVSLLRGAETRDRVASDGRRITRVERQVTLRLRVVGRGRLTPADVRRVRRIARREVARGEVAGKGKARAPGRGSRRP